MSSIRHSNNRSSKWANCPTGVVSRSPAGSCDLQDYVYVFQSRAPMSYDSEPSRAISCFRPGARPLYRPPAFTVEPDGTIFLIRTLKDVAASRSQSHPGRKVLRELGVRQPARCRARASTAVTIPRSPRSDTMSPDGYARVCTISPPTAIAAVTLGEPGTAEGEFNIVPTSLRRRWLVYVADAKTIGPVFARKRSMRLRKNLHLPCGLYMQYGHHRSSISGESPRPPRHRDIRTSWPRCQYCRSCMHADSASVTRRLNSSWQIPAPPVSRRLSRDMLCPGEVSLTAWPQIYPETTPRRPGDPTEFERSNLILERLPSYFDCCPSELKHHTQERQSSKSRLPIGKVLRNTGSNRL